MQKYSILRSFEFSFGAIEILKYTLPQLLAAMDL